MNSKAQVIISMEDYEEYKEMTEFFYKLGHCIKYSEKTFGTIRKPNTTIHKVQLPKTTIGSLINEYCKFNDNLNVVIVDEFEVWKEKVDE